MSSGTEYTQLHLIADKLQELVDAGPGGSGGGDASAANQVAEKAVLDNILAALASVNVVGPLTNTQLRALAVPVSGTFWQATQPVSVGPATSRAYISQGDTADHTIVAASASKIIKVYRLIVSCSVANSITFKGSVSGTFYTLFMAANTPLILPLDGNPWWTGAASEGFVLQNTVGTNVSGFIEYTQI